MGRGGHTATSISIVSPPPKPRNTEAQQKHTVRSGSAPTGGAMGTGGAQGCGGMGGDSVWGRDPAGCDGTGMLEPEQRGDPTRRTGGPRGGGEGGMNAAGCSLIGLQPPPQRGAQWDGGRPPPPWGHRRRDGDVGSPHGPGDKQQTAENPPVMQSKEVGMGPFPQGEPWGSGAAPSPSSGSTQHLLVVLSGSVQGKREGRAPPPPVRDPTVGTTRGWESIGAPRGGCGGRAVPMGCGGAAAHRQTDTGRVRTPHEETREGAPDPRIPPNPTGGDGQTATGGHGTPRRDGGAAP